MTRLVQVTVDQLPTLVSGVSGGDLHLLCSKHQVYCEDVTQACLMCLREAK